MTSLFRGGDSRTHTLFLHSVKKTSKGEGDGKGPLQSGNSGGRGVRRLYYQNGVLTMERIWGTNRLFLSFHYQPDSFRVARVKGMRRIAAAANSKDERRLQVGSIGIAQLRKHESSNDPTRSWKIRRWRIGRISAKQTWREMDGSSFESNDWEKISNTGDEAVKKWINKQMKKAACLVVLIGSQTAGRDWINYEIEHAWAEGKGVLGVYIHKLVGSNGKQAEMGSNPFEYFSIGERGLSEVVSVYNPPFEESSDVYEYIRRNMDSWIFQAIEIRRSEQTAVSRR
jgi:hypothetical protein